MQDLEQKLDSLGCCQLSIYRGFRSTADPMYELYTGPNGPKWHIIACIPSLLLGHQKYKTVRGIGKGLQESIDDLLESIKDDKQKTTP